MEDLKEFIEEGEEDSEPGDLAGIADILERVKSLRHLFATETEVQARESAVKVCYRFPFELEGGSQMGLFGNSSHELPARARRIFLESGSTPAQFDVLEVLLKHSGSGYLSYGEIAAEAGVEVDYAQKTVKKLWELKLLIFD